MTSVLTKLDQLPLFSPPFAWATPDRFPAIPPGIPVAVDTETRDDGIGQGLGPGWPFGLCRVIGISLAWREDGEVKGVYLPIRHPDSQNMPVREVSLYVSSVLSAASQVVTFNLAYDLPVLALESVIVDIEKCEDAYVCAALLSNTEFSYSLDSCCEREGIAGKDTQLLSEALMAYTGKPDNRGQMWRLPARYVGPYAEQDAVSTLILWEILKKRLTNEDMLEAYRTEIDLVEVVTEMRRKGIPIDTDRAVQAREELSALTKANLRELGSQCGRDMSIADLASAKRLARCFDALDIAYGVTRTGLPSFESDWLSNHTHPFAQLVAKTRATNDLGEKFIANYFLGFTHNGAIHPEWNCLRDSSKGAKTGRMSSSNPPMQQIPARKEFAANIIRGLIRSRYDDGVILSVDYKAQEPRLAVHFAEKMSAAGASDVGDRYRIDPDTDLHQVCADIIGIPRSQAKIIVLGIMYGMQPKSMSMRLRCSEAEAKALYARVLEAMPWLKELSEAVTNAADARGNIRLLDGARLFFNTWEPRRWADAEGQLPLKKAEADIRWKGVPIRRAMVRKAFNYLIQGSAARQTKRAMVACYKASKAYLPLATVHDELVFDVREQSHSNEIQRIMIETSPLTIPVGVDAEHGRTWAVAGKHKFKTVSEALAHVDQ